MGAIPIAEAQMTSTDTGRGDGGGQRGDDDQLDPDTVNQLLRAWSCGDQGARDRLIPVVYDELRRLARRHMRAERLHRTLQTTALVNEAYLRLAGQRVSWQNRAHFFAIAARLMRRILVDRARARQRLKRGGEQLEVSFDEELGQAEGEPELVDLIALDQALAQLARFDPRQAQIVELRFFAGLTIRETSELIEVSHTTVEKEWSLARAWLRRALEPRP